MTNHPGTNDERPATSDDVEPDFAVPFTRARRPCGTALLSPNLAGFAIHLFTTREVELRGDRAAQGWRQVAASVGVPASRLVRLKQLHGTAAIAIRAGEEFSVADDELDRPHADIVMTDDCTVAVAVQVADCVPLLLADRATGAVAAVHAGWRGTAAGAVGETIAAMRVVFGTRAADVVAAIGPCIGPCCYEVGADVLDAFRRAGFLESGIGRWFLREPDGSHFMLDLARATNDQLQSAGVDRHSIVASGLCTACHPALFHSYRRDGAGTGRLAAVIRPRETGE
jgi:YfiH family protein